MRRVRTTILLVLAVLTSHSGAYSQNNVIDEVVWVVGDEAIYKSEVEEARRSAQLTGERFDGDPYCVIPEELAINKLYLNQAKIDSIFAQPSDINQRAQYSLDAMISRYGSQEKLLEYTGMTLQQIRERLYEQAENSIITEEVTAKIVEKIKVTPTEVRRYVKDVIKEDIPFIPTQVEVQIITQEPVVPQEEIDRIKEDLRGYSERIQAGEVQFSTLALLYSEDPGSARQGGECGFMGRGEMVPEFSAVAFNLTDPAKVSKIVETEFGFHIIQLIERRGDRINVRHILKKPQVPQSVIDNCMLRLDSIATDIRNGRFSFEEGATYISADKDTRNNKGLMTYHVENSRAMVSKFELRQLPQDVGKVVGNMEVGEISKPFVMQLTNGKKVCAIVKLKSKTEGHKATVSDDYQVLHNMVLEIKQAEAIEKWIKEKQRVTYVKINEGWEGCDFKYPGWGER